MSTGAIVLLSYIITRASEHESVENFLSAKNDRKYRHCNAGGNERLRERCHETVSKLEERRTDMFFSISFELCQYTKRAFELGISRIVAVEKTRKSNQAR